METKWRAVSIDTLRDMWSKICLARGVCPFAAYTSEEYDALRYIEVEAGKWQHWIIRRKDKEEIKLTWSQVSDLLFSLVGGIWMVEVFPPPGQIVNSANHRHFWAVNEKHLPTEKIDLR
jgi:hypothetical protein